MSPIPQVGHCRVSPVSIRSRNRGTASGGPDGHAGRPPGRGTMQATILVADDDESIRLILSTLFEEAGYHVLCAEDGRMAVELAVQHRPDVTILDVLMPGMDGFAACRAIKTDRRTADIPVLLLTALAQTTSKVQGLEYGANDYITKPFETVELLARLRNTLTHKSHHDALATQALTDPLTGLTNRRGLEQQLDQLLAHGARTAEIPSLA